MEPLQPHIIVNNMFISRSLKSWWGFKAFKDFDDLKINETISEFY